MKRVIYLFFLLVMSHLTYAQLEIYNVENIRSNFTSIIDTLNGSIDSVQIETGDYTFIIETNDTSIFQTIQVSVTDNFGQVQTRLYSKSQILPYNYKVNSNHIIFKLSWPQVIGNFNLGKLKLQFYSGSTLIKEFQKPL